MGSSSFLWNGYDISFLPSLLNFSSISYGQSRLYFFQSLNGDKLMLCGQGGGTGGLPFKSDWVGDQVPGIEADIASNQRASQLLPLHAIPNQHS